MRWSPASRAWARSARRPKPSPGTCATRRSRSCARCCSAMVEDIRVVLIRLAERTQTLRFLDQAPTARRARRPARETLDLFAPLANRLGVWQLKWELEDLSFRCLEPETYKKIAQLLDEKRARARALHRGRHRRAQARARGAPASRPRSPAGRSTSTASGTRCARKDVDFDELYDVRARARDRRRRQGLLRGARRGARPVDADPERVRRLHRAAQGQRLPVAAHRGDRARRQAARSADPHRRDAPARRATASPRTGATRKAAGVATSASQFDAEDRVAAPGARVERRGRRQRRAGRAVKTSSSTTRSTCSRRRARWSTCRAGATPVDFAYHAAHRPRPPLPRRARSTARWCRSTTRCRTASASRSSPRSRAGPSRDWLNPAARLPQEPARARQGAPVVQRAAARARPSRRAAPWSRRSCSAQGATARQPRRSSRRRCGFAKLDDLFAAVARDEVNLRQLQAAMRRCEAGRRARGRRCRRHASEQGARRPAAGVLVVGVDRPDDAARATAASRCRRTRSSASSRAARASRSTARAARTSRACARASPSG